ncbi:GntR family transcriptional regulator [Brevibacillus reuszeri]|uniref:GntR family transcriptional regulator n=2 Tax=Brevibacillus reuszeri TaxID=54915 RepID=A0ABQ0TKS2_9BACL|nr:GntR family transcriptional regulator [Brevibacillus reuszeri]MED1856801.1 GntR family transcriptional regulator [Brevibacillus reuszeri]GED68450.1 GntR family transcriptional regulator [Brevibacillus reuszeri]
MMGLGKTGMFDNLNLHERVYLYLRDKIVHNSLKPGSRIDYDELMAELGVSRTPVRDALNRLQIDNLIEVRPRSGTFVSTPNKKAIEDLYNVRKPLESTAVELAAPHLSDESYLALLEEAERAEVELKKGNPDVFFAHDRHFHRTLISHSDNSRLIAIMDSLEVQVKWFGIIMTKNLDRPYRAIEMHKSIVHAMRDNKIDEARQLMELHIEEVKQDIMSDFPTE